MNPPEPVAVIGPTYTLLWPGAGVIEPIIRRNNLKVGDKLYGPQVAARLAKIEATLPGLIELLGDAWGDIHELVRHEKYLRDGGTMHITDNGIAQSETIIANLKAAGRKLRMWQEGVTEEDLFIPENERN